MNWFQRKRFVWIHIKHADEDLNRRVDAENILLEVAKGTRPIPTRLECRQLALFLGTRGMKKPEIKG